MTQDSNYGIKQHWPLLCPFPEVPFLCVPSLKETRGERKNARARWGQGGRLYICSWREMGFFKLKVPKELVQELGRETLSGCFWRQPWESHEVLHLMSLSVLSVQGTSYQRKEAMCISCIYLGVVVYYTISRPRKREWIERSEFSGVDTHNWGWRKKDEYRVRKACLELRNDWEAPATASPEHAVIERERLRF